VNVDRTLTATVCDQFRLDRLQLAPQLESSPRIMRLVSLGSIHRAVAVAVMDSGPASALSGVQT
jgi:hypothetical protein